LTLGVGRPQNGLNISKRNQTQMSEESFMKKLSPKPFKKRKRRKRSQRESQPKDIHRRWGLATRLEHRRVKEKRK